MTRITCPEIWRCEQIFRSRRRISRARSSRFYNLRDMWHCWDFLCLCNTNQKEKSNSIFACGIVRSNKRLSRYFIQCIYMFLKDEENLFIYEWYTKEKLTQGRHVRPLRTAAFGSVTFSDGVLVDFRSRRQISHNAVIWLIMLRIVLINKTKEKDCNWKKKAILLH